MHSEVSRVSKAFTPVAPPTIVRDMYTDEENDLLFGVLRDHGPWSLIAAQTFKSAEEFIAVAGGKGATASGLSLIDMITPTFRGYFAQQGVALYGEIQDVFYDSKLLNLVKNMFGARYGFPAQFFFNVRAPARSLDAGHFDPQVWRGMDMVKPPTWFTAVMAKSGLFDRWEVKTGQVITYYYRLSEDGGFTYWPDGPTEPPARIPAPLWNDAVVVHNPRMYHRGEASGPRNNRANPANMTLESVIAAESEDTWVMRNGAEVIARYPLRDMRFLFHYGARIFNDLAEVNQYYDHTDDLTPEKALDVLIHDLGQRGIRFAVPNDPMTDTEFIKLLTSTYAVAPTSYPPEAPVDRLSA
jgi:hypothetical protein